MSAVSAASATGSPAPAGAPQTPATHPLGGPPPLAGEGCPLCGTPLRPEQEWCLRCGAAARTRLASTPNWRTPLIALGLAIVVALGALTASLVKLAGGPRTTPASTITRTVTTPTSATPGATTPGATTPGALTPGAGTPGATSSLGSGAAGGSSLGTTTPRSGAPATTTPGATRSGAAGTPGATATTPAGAVIPGTKLRVPGASAQEASRISNLLSPHAKR
ncbi:MAG TPA: hypothetical protein VID29_01730 [Solirubrobacteraceae bacterium]